MFSDLKKVNIYLRLIIVSVICVVTHTLSAQMLIDDFQDGNTTSNPTWEGNTENFTVNSSGELQLDATAAGMSYLSTSVGQSASAETEWRFYIKQSFSGSDNNTSRLYLMSSLPTIDYTGTGGASVEGYFLQFGESGSDDALRLVRNDLDGTTIDIAEGIAGFVSSSFEITVKVVRTALGDWEIWADANAGEEFSLQATGTDATYSFVNHFGWVCKYTSSNADNFFLDNVYIGEPLLDNDPPVLTQLIVDSSSELTLEFNEPLNGVSAETLSNYSVSSGIGNPTTAIFSNPNLVTLTFGTSFASEEELILTLTGVTDVAGNEITSTEEQFTYFEISEPQLGDIIINEIFADPTPAIGLPDKEWLELYNTSENAFDISLLEFYNTTTLNPIESYVLPSGGYVVISNESGTSALQTFGETASASSFSALTNSGDSLTLLYNGTVIDRVVYEDDWYSDAVKEDGGWSLERINPNALCSGSQNWIASNSVLGGTPGIQNSVNDETPDTEVPQITSASLINETLIFLQADEILNQVLETTNFSVSGGYEISAVQLTSSANGILVTLDEPAEVGVPFTIIVSSLTDCEGNENTAITEWQIASGFPAEVGDIIITEIMADPSPQVGLPEVEYAELYNASDLFIDISDAEFSGAAFTSSVILAPGEYRVIMSEEDIASNFIFSGASGMTGWGSTFLTNSGKELILATSNGVIDEVTYNNTWYQNSDKDEGGWSLELINPTHPCSDKANWRASESVFGGSPAELNSVFSLTEDTQAPQVILAYAFLSNSIFIEFDEPVNESSFSSAVISLSGENSNSITSQGIRSIIVNFQEGLTPALEYTLSVSGIEDCWGNVSATQEVRIGLPEQAEAGDLIINEVLSNPRGSGSDYVEIYNNSNKIISLQNWHLANRNAGLIDSQELITEFPLPIFPGDYALFTESLGDVAVNYPNAAVNKFIVMDLPAYSNDEGDVVLLLPDNEISDEFGYSSDYHFDLLDETDGVSLERISFTVPTQNSDNWSSAAESENYGSPGYRNSQTQSKMTAGGTVSVYPPVFSPGGSQDINNLEISYSFSANSQAASVTIYSKDGVKTRVLKSNILIGSEGTFFWDGADDQGRAVPTGIYVIYFEVFALDGSVGGYKVPATVAYR